MLSLELASFSSTSTLANRTLSPYSSANLWRKGNIKRLDLGVVNGSPKNESRQILPKAWNLAELANGSQSLRFCVCWSHICFSISVSHYTFSSQARILRCQPLCLGESQIHHSPPLDFSQRTNQVLTQHQLYRFIVYVMAYYSPDWVEFNSVYNHHQW